MRWAVPLLMCLAIAGVAYGDPTNLEDGVFIAHHPPGLQFSQGTDWCQKYIDEYAITSCKQQHNRIDLDGNVGESSVWYVLAAWSEAKEWCGTEFGFGQYDANIYGFLRWGPCSPQGELELPTDNWPAPNEGTAITTTSTAWSGNFVPVYYFAGYAYYEGVIPVAADPATGFGGTGNCATPPEAWAAADFGGMGLFTAGTYVCPGGGDGGAEGDGSEDGEEEYPGGDDSGPAPLLPGTYAEDAVIIRFAPGVISFPQDREVDPQYFRAPLPDAMITLPTLRARLEELGVDSLATFAPSWRHLDANPAASLDLHGNRVDLVDFTDVYLAGLNGLASASEVIAGLWHRSGIVYVEADIKLYPHSCPQEPYPDDDLYADQWYLNNTDENCDEDPHHYWDLNVPQAWELCSCCGFGTKLAVIDGIFNGDHEELGPYIDMSLSRSFPDPGVSWNSAPCAGHGTACASMAAAATHNDGRGFASIPHLPSAPGDGVLVALRCCWDEPPDNYAFWSMIGQAISYVCGPTVNRRVGVISNSMGRAYWKYCYYAMPRSALEAFRNAYRLGISHVCCTGNDLFEPPNPCEDPDSSFLYPAALPDYTLGVGGINCHGEANPDWCVGSYIDVVGPAVGLWVASSGVDGYEWIPESGPGGTSLAAPVIAGAIALLLGEDPGLTNEDCSALLELSADDMGQPAYAVGSGLPRLDRAMAWLTSDCRVVHGFTTQVHMDEVLEGRYVQFRNVEGITVGEDTWEPFWVVPHRLETVVALPGGDRISEVWARGRGSSGWRLIDRDLDGNPNPDDPPHYDGLFYDNWATVRAFDSLTGECVVESYTYEVLLNESPPEWVWVPHDIGSDYRLQYSYVCCGAYEECLDLSVAHEESQQSCDLRVCGSPARQGGEVKLQFRMPAEGRVWLDVYGADGRVVQNLARGVQVGTGASEVRWNLEGSEGRFVSSGIYFVRMKGVLDGREGTVSRTRVVVVR
jgi:hypothetical protein